VEVSRAGILRPMFLKIVSLKRSVMLSVLFKAKLDQNLKKFELE